jgi:hypothetical protein
MVRKLTIVDYRTQKMKRSPGLKIAVHRRMSKQQPVIPVKQYGRPDLERLPLPRIVTAPPDLSLVVDELRNSNKRLRDKIARMETILQDELRYWKRGLESGDWETREQLQRRMSRLRGAVEYLGTETGWRVNER